MRLGAPISIEPFDPAWWIAALRHKGYTAAYCPVGWEAGAETIRDLRRAAETANIVIAEVGAWHNNPISRDETVRQAGIQACQQQLALAEEIGARCCVNVAGSLGEHWDGPDLADYSPEAFERIVDSVRAIVDAVRPTRTCYTLEPMPWMLPDSIDSYLELIRAIDRPSFAVHLDPINLITTPRQLAHSGTFFAECISRLGPYIRSIHAKDLRLRPQLTVHLEEVRPGLGQVDYAAFLRAANRLEVDTPFLLEHLATEEEYDLSAAFVRQTAAGAGIQFAG